MLTLCACVKSKRMPNCVPSPRTRVGNRAHALVQGDGEGGPYNMASANKANGSSLEETSGSLKWEEDEGRPSRADSKGESGGEGKTYEERQYIGSDKYRKPLSMFYTSQEEDYTKKLPRSSRKNKVLCLGLSCWSWLFLTAAFLQAALILGLQVAIAVLGNFRGDRLNQYVDCFERSIGYDSSTELPANITFPTFGRDKEVYVYFFISLVLYNFALCIYALKVHNIVEVYMFLIINLLAIGYAGVQVFQFRGFGDDCDLITQVGYLALANGFLLIVFTVIFVVMSRFIYIEFGWKIYTRVGCNSDLRRYYRVYEVVMSGVKLLILFMLIFLLSQCILLLYVDENNINYEFWVVIFVLVPFALISFPLSRWIVRREHIVGSICLFFTDIAVIAYNSYKIFRYTTRSCPLCREQVSDLEEEVKFIETQLNTNSSSSTVREIVDRIEQFEHLVLLGVINLVIAVLVLLVFLYLLKQYRKGLREYFASQRSGGRYMCKSCCPTGAYDVSDGQETRSVFLNLRKVAHKWSDNRGNDSSKQSLGLVLGYRARDDGNKTARTIGPIRNVTIQED